MAKLEPPDYAAHVAAMDAERARQHLAAWGVQDRTDPCPGRVTHPLTGADIRCLLPALHEGVHVGPGEVIWVSTDG